MGQKMTWEEMKKAFPDEWLLITDYETDQYGTVSVGVVERHSTNKDEVYRLPALDKDCAFEYTGESTFRGFRDHAKHHCF
ncbi:MAG: hypothetical protein ABH871_08460 [Pseudomonadota bacterium]